MEFSTLSEVRESQIFHFKLVQVHPKPVSYDHQENEDMIDEANIIIEDENDYFD